MSLRTFILGLSASFGIAWLAVVVVPHFKMRNLQPIADPQAEATAGIFFPKRTGRIADGARVFAENGCYLCHTQVVRPTYAGNDLFRPDWGGLKADPDRGDTRRETNAFDFIGEEFAQIGVMRMGPDLSNVARRVEAFYAPEGDAEAWFFRHLYNPRSIPERWKSTCQPNPFLFEKREIKGNPSIDAVKVNEAENTELVPGPDARALVSYLLSLRKDHPVPATLNFAPGKKESGS